MSTVGGDIAAARTRSSAPPTSAPSSPPTSPTTGQTEAYMDGKHWGPDAARQANVHAPLTLRDRLADWFPGMLPTSPNEGGASDSGTIRAAHVTRGNVNPWPGSLVLLAASASVLALRHRFAVKRVPFGAILVNQKTNQPVSQAMAQTAGTRTAQAGSKSKVAFGMPLTIVRDTTFAQESVSSVSLDEAISHWRLVYKGMAVGSAVLAGMAVWNVAMSPMRHQELGKTVAVGQMGEQR